jgi:hypothetical protein
VADVFRAEAEAEMRSLSPGERVALAFRLGDDDVEVYRTARDLDRGAAETELRRRRLEGRQPCRCLKVDSE